jgi:HSP20 family molecular chaperone IbpA
MSMIDFAPLSRSTIGFDRLFDMLDQTSSARSASAAASGAT